MSPTSPRLWIVATPLGNTADLSPRARTILSNCDCILAEDTRRAQNLLRELGIAKKTLLSFYDHNEEDRLPDVLARLRRGEDVALVSDAGTPLLADPGYRLVRACRKEHIPVSPVPGPSAPVAALSAAGLPPLPYSFLGFLPRDEAGQSKLFTRFRSAGTLVFFERADRLCQSLKTAYSILGTRELAICRELTKVYEEFIVLRLEDYASLPSPLLGELTVLIGPPLEPLKTSEAEVRALLQKALACGEKPRKCVQRVSAEVLGWDGKAVYGLLERLKQGE